MTDTDIAGRDRLAWNTFVSWAGQLASVATGFILPRLIDRQLGQVNLGLWDFSWAFINYLSLFHVGLPSSVNRYVAVYYAESRVDKLRSMLGTVLLIQTGQGILVILLACLIAICLPHFYADSLKEDVAVAQSLVVLLGASLSMRMFFSSSSGLLTGFHRWDINNSITSIASLIQLISFVGVLMIGGGISALALAYLVTTTITEASRGFMARRLWPEIAPNYKQAKMSEAKELILFGLKTLASFLPGTVIIQTACLVFASAAGPAALAVLMRPIGLIRQVRNFVNRFTYMLTPTAGSLSGSRDTKALGEFLIQSSAYSLSFTFPPMLALAIFGDLLLKLWMGPGFANWPLIAILAAGNTLQISQDASMRILMGMNAHGKLSIRVGIVAMMAFGLCLLWNHWHGISILSTAVAIVTPVSLSYGILVPFMACRHLHVSFSKFLLKAIVYPVLSSLPFAILIAAARYYWQVGNLTAALICALTSGPALAASYLVFVFPRSLRSRLMSLIP